MSFFLKDLSHRISRSVGSITHQTSHITHHTGDITQGGSLHRLVQLLRIVDAGAGETMRKTMYGAAGRTAV